MTSINSGENELSFYFNSSLSHNSPNNVKASKAANIIDRPLKDVIDACKKFDQEKLVYFGNIRDLI